MNIRIHTHFPVPKPREVLLLQHAKLRKSHSNKFLVLPKQQKSLFLWSNTLDPPLLPLLWGEWGREEGEWRKCPFRGGWLSQGWNSEGWTDRHDPDSLSPGRRRQRKVTPACPSLSLCSSGVFCTSVCSSHTLRPQLNEFLLPVTDRTQQRHQVPTEVDFWPLPGQHSLQSHLGTQLKRSVSERLMAEPLSSHFLWRPGSALHEKAESNWRLFNFLLLSHPQQWSHAQNTSVLFPPDGLCP